MKATLRRIWAIAEKEVLHLKRDPLSLALALLMPLVMIVLFGYGVSFDLDKLPVRVSDADGSVASRELSRRLLASGEFVGERGGPHGEPFAPLVSGEVGAMILIPYGFERDLMRGQTPGLQLLIDGADAATANQVRAKAEQTLRILVASMRRPPGQTLLPRVEARTWTRFNPEGRSVVFLAPGIAAFILAIVAVLLTALTVAREWEQGSMAQLFATPVRRIDIVFGKLLPYIVLGGVAVLLVVAAGMSIFDVPFRGSAVALFVLSVLFLVGMLGQGLLISIATRNQMVATQVATMSSMLPAMLLSGFLFPIENMPAPLQAVTAIIPARYFVDGLRGVLLRGNDLQDVANEAFALGMFATVVIVLSTLRFKRSVA